MNAPSTASPHETTLVIIGDTLHCYDDEGRLATHGALAAQLDLWARLFDRVRFCGVLQPGAPPAGFATYTADNIELVELRRAGGSGAKAKLGVLRAWASWARTVGPELKAADAAHLRTPCNVTLLGIVMTRVLVRHRYAIFAGSWHRYPGEPWSYGLQRSLLRHMFGGTVHAYLPPDEVPDRPNIRHAFSPVVSEVQLAEIAAAAAHARASTPVPGRARPLRAVCVGRFSVNKNQATLVGALRELHRRGIDIECQFVGDGSERESVMKAASALPSVTFCSAAGRSEVFDAMAWADVNILPSFSEGFPKVLIEGMSAGALPIASDTPMNRSMTETTGWVFDPSESSSLVHALEAALALTPDQWNDRRSSSTAFARRHTLDQFEKDIAHIVRDAWKMKCAGANRG